MFLVSHRKETLRKTQGYTKDKFGEKANNKTKETQHQPSKQLLDNFVDNFPPGKYSWNIFVHFLDNSAEQKILDTFSGQFSWTFFQEGSILEISLGKNPGQVSKKISRKIVQEKFPGKS